MNEDNFVYASYVTLEGNEHPSMVLNMGFDGILLGTTRDAEKNQITGFFAHPICPENTTKEERKIIEQSGMVIFRFSGDKSIQTINHLRKLLDAVEVGIMESAGVDK